MGGFDCDFRSVWSWASKSHLYMRCLAKWKFLNLVSFWILLATASFKGVNCKKHRAILASISAYLHSSSFFCAYLGCKSWVNKPFQSLILMATLQGRQDSIQVQARHLRLFGLFVVAFADVSGFILAKANMKLLWCWSQLMPCFLEKHFERLDWICCCPQMLFSHISAQTYCCDPVIHTFVWFEVLDGKFEIECQSCAGRGAGPTWPGAPSQGVFGNNRTPNPLEIISFW